MIHFFWFSSGEVWSLFLVEFNQLLHFGGELPVDLIDIQGRSHDAGNLFYYGHLFRAGLEFQGQSGLVEKRSDTVRYCSQQLNKLRGKVVNLP